MTEIREYFSSQKSFEFNECLDRLWWLWWWWKWLLLLKYLSTFDVCPNGKRFIDDDDDDEFDVRPLDRCKWWCERIGEDEPDDPDDDVDDEDDDDVDVAINDPRLGDRSISGTIWSPSLPE